MNGIVDAFQAHKDIYAGLIGLVCFALLFRMHWTGGR
jgi:hypothetical protein